MKKWSVFIIKAVGDTYYPEHSVSKLYDNKSDAEQFKIDLGLGSFYRVIEAKESDGKIIAIL